MMRANRHVIVIVIVIFKQGFHSVKNTDFQWSPAKQAYIHTYTNTYIHTYIHKHTTQKGIQRTVHKTTQIQSTKFIMI